MLWGLNYTRTHNSSLCCSCKHTERQTQQLELFLVSTLLSVSAITSVNKLFLCHILLLLRNAWTTHATSSDGKRPHTKASHYVLIRCSGKKKTASSFLISLLDFNGFYGLAGQKSFSKHKKPTKPFTEMEIELLNGFLIKSDVLHVHCH